MKSIYDKKPKILLAEDEETLAAGLEYNLCEEGYEVDWARDGKKAIELIDENEYDLVTLDIMLPYFDGFQIAEYIRKLSPQIPILILTARTSNLDKVKGLELGVDDYITKPFHLEELLLRIKGMLKRKNWYKTSTEIEPEYCFGNNKINFNNLQCSHGNSKFMLTQKEAMVLKYLIEHKGIIVSRKELLENVWNLSSDVETRTVDIFISRLRKIFESDSNNPIYIKSIRSSGYTFNS